MICYPTSEKSSSVVTVSGLVKRGAVEISALTLEGGVAATGATVDIIDSLTATGTSIWHLQAPQYGSASISFPKPIPASTGIYATFTGSASKLSIAYN